MDDKDGVGRPEVWVVYIDGEITERRTENGDPVEELHYFVKHELVQTCTFLGDRRPATRVSYLWKRSAFAKTAVRGTFAMAGSCSPQSRLCSEAM